MKMYRFTLELNELTEEQRLLVPVRLGNCVLRGNILICEQQGTTYRNAVYNVHYRLFKAGITYTNPVRYI